MKKKLLAAAVGATLATAASVGQAESLLFPYFQSGNGVYSFLTLLNTQAGVGGISTGVQTHYIWTVDYMDTTATECQHNDEFGTLTLNDLLHQDVLDPDYGGIDLPTAWGDSASGPNYFSVSPVQGYIIVESSDQLLANGSPSGLANNEGGESTLAGQVIVVNGTTGFISAQKGLNNPGVSTAVTSAAGNPAGNFNNILTSHQTYDMTWYPASVVSTSWYVLVTGVNMDIGTEWEGAVQMNNGYGAAGITYDHDENPISGNVPVNIVCHAFLERDDFLTPHQLNETSMGGYYWGVFATARNDFDTTGVKRFDSTGVLMTKLEETSVLGGVATSSMENAWPNLPY